MDKTKILSMLFQEQAKQKTPTQNGLVANPQIKTSGKIRYRSATATDQPPLPALSGASPLRAVPCLLPSLPNYTRH